MMLLKLSVQRRDVLLGEALGVKGMCSRITGNRFKERARQRRSGDGDANGLTGFTLLVVETMTGLAVEEGAAEEEALSFVRCHLPLSEAFTWAGRAVQWMGLGH